jgi:hypothetical protein
VTCRPAKALVLSKEKPMLYQPPLPPNETRSSDTPLLAAHSHPDCRGILILIVAPQPRHHRKI